MPQGFRSRLLLAVLSLAACTASEKTGNEGDPEVATVSIAPAVDTIEVGQTATFTAIARDEDGATIAGKTATWLSSNTAVATVSDAGVVTAVVSGASNITATIDGVVGSAIIVVLTDGEEPPGDVATVTITPPSASLAVGATVQLVATPQDAEGVVVTGVTPVWTTENGHATVSTTGLVTAASVGTDTVYATVGTVSGTSIITVTSVPVGNIVVSPSQGTLDAAGATQQLTATVTSEGGAPLPGTKLTWTSSNTAVARVDSTGFVTTSLVPGAVTVTASAGGKAGTANFNVILRFRGISAGNGPNGWHTCGVTAIRAAYCWGMNNRGQMGIGTTTNWNGPIAVIGSHAFTSIATGSRHSCGLTVNGDAYCWGAGNMGQLGNSNNGDQQIPVKVAGSVVFDTTSITAGAEHSCALTPAGLAYCWGNNASDQLGTGTGNVNVPTLVSGGQVFAQISAGAAHSCGVTTGGQAYCWGDNTEGRLGTGDSTDRAAPAAVAGGFTFRSVSAGSVHSCGVATSGTLYCWGGNTNGELGTGNFNSSPTPTPVFGGQSWDRVDAGPVGSCGVVEATTTGGRSAHCWGSNLMQGIGNGDTVTVTKYVVPTAVQGPSASSVSRGESHSCLVSTSGVAYCWGRNSEGQMGNGVFTVADPFSIALPTKVIGQP